MQNVYAKLRPSLVEHDSKGMVPTNPRPLSHRLAEGCSGTLEARLVAKVTSIRVKSILHSPS
jgi:hypothetical protein